MPIGLTSDIQRMRDLLKKLQKPSPVRERLDAGKTVFLPPEEAVEAGLPGDYPADWMLKITPGRNGDEATFSYRSPEGQEFAEPPFVPEYIAREEFWERRPELRPPVPEIEAPEVEPWVPPEGFGELVKRVYGPEYTIEDFASLVSETPERFVKDLEILGKTPEVETILSAIGFTWDDIFAPMVPTPPQFEVPAWLTLDFWKEALFRPYTEEDLAGKAYASFVAGIGDVITTTGGAARWLGYEDVGGVLSTIGSKLQSVAPPDTTGEFEMAELLDPEFYATKITRTIPFALSLAPLAIGGFYGGSTIATTLGLGRLASWIIGGFFGAALSRPLESALEAGSQYDDAIARGKTEKEATEEANEVFRKNMVLAGMDAFQIAIALAPTPKWVPLGLVRAGLVRTIRIGGKMVIIGLTEGGEEVYQDMVQRHARGEEWQLDPIAKEVFAIGMVMGLGMGLGGDVITGLVEKAKGKMPPDIKGDFDVAVKRFEAEGFRKDQAELKALDIISRTPEGEKIVTETLKELKEAVPPAVPAVPVVPEVVPEVKALTEDVWDISPVEDRASWAKLAGLEGKVGSKAWADLTTGEKGALRLAREEIAPTLPEVKPPAVEVMPGVKEINALEREMQASYGWEIGFRNDLKWTQSRSYFEGGKPNLIIGTKDASISEIKLVTYHEWAHLIAETEGLQALSPEQFKALGEKLGTEVDAWLWAIEEAKRTGIDLTKVSRLLPENIKTLSVIQEQLVIPKPPAVEEVKPPPPKITEAERVGLRMDEMQAEVGGLKEWLATEPATKLVSLIKRTGWYKGEISNLTVAQYKKLTGKSPLANILTADKKHVKWEYAIDDIATEMGFESGEALKEGIERAGETLAKIKELEREIKVTEIPKEKPPAPPKVAPVPLVSQMKEIYGEIQVTVEATRVSIKGLIGDEAAVARETLSGLERELAYIDKTIGAFEKRPDMPEATKLRSTIMAMARFKGLPKTQLQDIFSSVAGRRQLRVIKQEHLVGILEKVKEARPVRIAGEKVITPKTEAKIQSLKESLISSRQMTNEIYNHLMERLNLRTDRYEHAQKFITESEAKELIMAMNDEVVLAEWDIKVSDALAKNPKIKEVRDGLNDRGMKGIGVEIEGKPVKISRGAELWSMRYYTLNLQKKVAAPVYDGWQKINQAHLVARDRHNQQISRLAETTPNFKEVVNDEAALKRIEDYIASKHKLAKIKAPELSDDEMAIATELERGYFEAENEVRFIRFVNAYAEKEGDIDLIAKEIPSAPKRALRRAIDIYEGKGAEQLRTFTDTQKWGVIGTGYDPRSFIKPILYFRPPKETTFAKGLLRTRDGVEYEADDTNIIQRYSRHQRQLIALQEMSNLIRAFGRQYAEHAHKLDPTSQRNVSKVLSRGLNEMKGYREDGGAIVHLIERLYGQVAAVVFWRPDLVARNKFQNFAFNPDYWAGRFLDPRNKALTPERRRWWEVFVSQERVFQYDFLLYGEKPIPGFGRLVRWARRTSGYPWSDKSNRAEAFYVRINRVDRALEAYEKHGDVQKLIEDSGLNEFEPRQQAEALELLAMDSVDYGIDGMVAVSGKEAFTLYNAQQLVNNVHFLYDRSQRAPAEMGATGKTLGNILVFNRSWGERFVLQANKLSPESKANLKEKIKAVTVIVGVIVAGTITGETYRKITGKARNPYNPLNIITWSPGGLALGVTEDISNTIYLMTEAAKGDKGALGSLPGVISNVATLTLPFYKNAIQALDAITDMKGVDVWALRKIREMIDEEYEVRGGSHEVERTLLEKFQKAIFSLKDDPVTPQEKIEESESILGMDIDEEDLPFTLEEPDIHDMGKLNTDLSRILKNVKPEDITKESGYSELAIAWKEKETYEAIWNTMPHKKIYEITELPEELAKWANRNKRKLSLVAQYQKLEGAEAKAFLDKHPELKENPGVEWLKNFPLANARLALWGQTKIYSLEAYNEFNRLVKELDIPDDAIPELTLPPKGSVENYFKYQGLLTEFSPSSWEVQLLMLQDDNLRQFLERQPVETPVRSLELKIKHRPLFEQYDLLETDEDRAKLKADNPEWVDDMRRIEAIENAASDEIAESWVERGQLIDQFSAGSSEAMVWLLDNPEAFKWALENELLTDDGTDWNIPVLRINAKWREFDDKYLGYGDETSEFYIPDETERIAARDKLLLDEEYRKDRRRREAYGDGFSDDQIENFVDYHELPVKGYRQEQFLLDIPKFAREMHEIKGLDLPDPAKLPSPKYDEIYESRPDDFDKLWGLADHKSEHYIENERAREEARQAMRFDARGNPSDFYKDELRLDAYKLFIPEEHIESYVTMGVSPDKGYRDERYLKDNPRYYKEVWLGILKNDRIDVRKIPAKQYDDIYDRFKAQFDKWDAYKDPDSPLYIADPDERAKARERLLLDEAFAEARIRQAGYLTLIGHEEQVDKYVTYYQLLAQGKPKDVDVWYEDDWFLMENPEFYKAVRRALDWELRDFSKVPTKEVFRLYQIYRRLPTGKIRENYRAQHPELDKWMVLTGKVSKTMEEQEALAELSKAERMALEMWEREKGREEGMEKALEEMRRRLGELTR